MRHSPLADYPKKPEILKNRRGSGFRKGKILRARLSTSTYFINTKKEQLMETEEIGFNI